MKYSGKILVLAYPDTFVTMSDEWICKVLPLVGLGTREYIKAGHAALVLIENNTGRAQYFDFGRYVTPKGRGRVRSENTDAELAIPIKARLSKEGVLENFEEFLLWLDANPQKTHGEGRLVASVCDAVDHHKAIQYLQKLQDRGSIPYGAFDKMGSNCSRLVTDTILAATSEKKIIKALNFNKKFTPSTVGNVEKAAAFGTVYVVSEGKVKPFNGSALRENLTNYFDKKRSVFSSEKNREIPSGAQKLSGTGSNAWFELLSEEQLPENHFRIRRYNDLHEIDFDGVYISEELNTGNPFKFTYDSHCAYCHIIQQNKKIKLRCVSSFAAFNSSRKVHSA